MKPAEMSFLRRAAGLGLRDRVRSSGLWEGLKVEILLLLRRASWSIRPGCLRDATPERCSRHVGLGGEPGGDQGHAGKIIPLSWLRGTPRDCPGGTEGRWLERGVSGLLLSLYPATI